jgi:hypothetical protein
MKEVNIASSSGYELAMHRACGGLSSLYCSVDVVLLGWQWVINHVQRIGYGG